MQSSTLATPPQKAMQALRHKLDRLPRLDIRPPELPGPPGVAVSLSGRSSARSRRALLGALTGAGSGGTQSARARRRRAVRHDPVLLLVNRITQGFNLAEFKRAKALGYDAYLEEQLDHLSIDDSEMDARLTGYDVLTLTPKEIVDTYLEDPVTPFWNLKGTTLLRSVHSKRQLFERMCEFWSDHFSIDHQKDPMWAFKPEDDKVVIRQHALGTFPELLSASAHSGAMMYYLDNWLNIVGGIQENWARELMELHTLGVGNFTETDVKQVAECFSGWTLNADFESPDYLQWAFVPGFHQTGPKVVLGNNIPAFPRYGAGLRVLEILSGHTSTAQFISRKMSRWLLREDPPQELVDQVAQTYLSTGGDIKEMIRVILAKENLQYGSPVFAPKYKRPFNMMTSLLRGLEADVSDPLYLSFYLFFMGHSTFDWSPPNGYPDTVNVWGKSHLWRWTFANHLLSNIIPGVSLPLGTILNLLDGFNTPNIADLIHRRILGRSLEPEDLVQIEKYATSLSPLSFAEAYEVIGLAASAPGNQWY